MFALRLLSLSIFTAMSVSAQNQNLGYHAELVHPGGDPANGANVVLVNDSNLAIEAYHIRTELCPGASQVFFDSFAFGGDTTSYPVGTQPPGGSRSQSAPVLPGEKFVTMTHLPPKRDGCSPHGRIDAVLFSDGTFKGDKSLVRAMQAQRDGIAAAVHYWDAILHDERTEHSPYAIAPQAKANAEKLQSRTCQGFEHWTECDYWSGVRQVDQSLSVAGFREGVSAEEDFRSLVSKLDRWQRKIEQNAAFQTLEVTFPIPTKLSNDPLWSSLVLKNP